MDQQISNNTIFALDIGTRTVIGIVGRMEGNNFKVLAQEMQEHTGRSMFDGQIHDISQVAAVVAQIKASLEKKTRLTLNKVAVAAAGRSLKTVLCTAEIKQDENREIESLDIRSLELLALHQAQRTLEKENTAASDYYCVGYCPITYTVGDMPVTNPLGHRAAQMAVKAVATFLPVSVVNSLYAVLSRVQLEPAHLTLEPIAAIDAAIPTSFRMLNLALVDIGAGTADIAISQDGSIVAYGMVPLAGDEVTEPLMERLLVEFSEAEKIKRMLGDTGPISYTDIMGITNQISAEEVMEIIEPVVDKLAQAIGTAIMELNGGKSTKSVFCIGGGAQTPGLMEKLAQQLQLDPQRVAVRDRGFLRHFIPEDNDQLAGPEGVTVIGIATVALTRLGYEFISIKVNGVEHSIFNTNDLNVSQVLGYVQFDPRQLICKNGRDLQFTLNGEKHTVFGQLGQPARIFVGNRPANLQTQVRGGDEIRVLKAVHGTDATARIKDFLPDPKHPMQVLLNGTPAGPDTLIQPGDQVEIRDQAQIINKPEQKPRLRITVNGNEVILPQKEAIFVDIFNQVKIDTQNTTGTLVMKLNGNQAQYTDTVQDGDVIDVYWDA